MTPQKIMDRMEEMMNAAFAWFLIHCDEGDENDVGSFLRNDVAVVNDYTIAIRLYFGFEEQVYHACYMGNGPFLYFPNKR